MKMSKMRRDAAKANEGDWVERIPDFGDFAVKIRSLDADDCVAIQRDLYKFILGTARTRRDPDIPPPVANYVMAKTLIEAAVIDWKNWEEDDGAPVKYSRERLAAELLAPADRGIVYAGPDGVERVFHTPDKKQFNFEMRELLNALLWAAEKVDLGGDVETKKQSGAGSRGAAKNLST